jgi:hypothetical protein
MDVVGAEERLAAQVERLEQVQHLEHREALGRRRRLVDRDAAIAADDRLAPARLLCLEVRGGEEAVVGPRPAHQLLRHLALVEAVPAVARDRFQRARKVGIPEHCAVLEEDRRGFRALLQLGTRDGAPMREPRRHREAVAGIADRAVEAALQGQPPVRGVRLGPARHGAGHREGTGQHPAIGHFGKATPSEGIDRAAGRRPAAAVDVAHLFGLRVVDQPERIAADAGHMRIENRQRGAGGERGIDGRAARPQRVDAGGAGQRMRRGHHAVRRKRGRAARTYLCHEKLLRCLPRS